VTENGLTTGRIKNSGHQRDAHASSHQCESTIVLIRPVDAALGDDLVPAHIPRPGKWQQLRSRHFQHADYLGHGWARSLSPNAGDVRAYRVGAAARPKVKQVTLEQLRVFVAVAERQHVTRAAAVLNLAQSAVSAAIAALEARHGAKLFHRVGRGVELTDAGVLFLVEARAILARVEAAGQLLSELGDLKRGTLAVHASQTIAGYWLPRHLVAFRRKYPGIDIRLTIGNTAQGSAALREGAVDLAFIEGMIEDPMLIKQQVARDQLVIVVGAEHAWSTTDALEPARLIETDWVLREPGSGTRSTFEAALQGFGVSPGALRLALELPSNEAVRAAVEAGLGATAISASVAAPSLEAGLLHRVRFNLPEREFHVVRHLTRRRNGAADALLSMVTPRLPDSRVHRSSAAVQEALS
jgi:DNA-binding transcriptional LysR family regulator